MTFRYTLSVNELTFKSTRVVSWTCVFVCVVRVSVECFSDWKALHKGAAGTAAGYEMQEIGWKTCTCSPWDLITNQEFKFRLVRHGRAFPESSFSLQTQGLSTLCVSVVPVFSISNFLLSQITQKKEMITPIITSTYISTKPLNPAQTEWKCLPRRWAVVKVSPPLQQTTYNTARQHNTHCFQQELPTLLLTRLCLGFHLMLSEMVKPARGEFSYTWVRI